MRVWGDVHTSSAATIGEASGVIGREDTPHRGWYLSTYERSKTEGEQAVFEAGRQHGVEVVCVNPSSVQGPGRAGGTARFLLAYLDGRLKVFVPTNVSLVDISDCAEGHVLAAERGAAGERYLLNSIALSITEALALAGDVAGVAGGRAYCRARSRPRARTSSSTARGWLAASPPCAARWSAPCFTGTATTARAPSVSWGCATPSRVRRCVRRSTGRGPRGCCGPRARRLTIVR